MTSRIHLLLALIGVMFLNMSEARSSQSISEGFDVPDLDSASWGAGSITPEAFSVIRIALPELKKYPVSFERYRSVHVSQSERYYYVVFSPRELGSTASGRMPSEQLGLQVQISKATMQVTGTRAE